MSAPTIDCGSPPDGQVGIPYSHTLDNTHTGSVFTIAITAGALPGGLTMDAAGVITGTPTTPGTFDFTPTISTPTGAPGEDTATTDLPESGRGWDFRQSPNAPIPDASGAFEYAGAQYLFLFQGAEFGVGDLHIHVHKSTDAGFTWSDVADIGIPVGGAPESAAITHTVCVDGDIAYLMAVSLDGSTTTADPAGPLLLFNYDLTNDTFGPGSTPAGAPTIHKFWTGADFQPRSGVGLHLLRRGAGDMLLLYTDREGISGDFYARVSVATFNGSSFGASSMLPGQTGISDLFREKCAVVDSSGILHTVIHRSSNHSFKYVGMNSSGSFGTSQVIETDVFFVEETSNMLVFSTGGTETVAFLAVRNRSSSNSDGDLTIYHAPAGTLTPTWSHSTVLSTAHVVLDARFAPDFPMALGVVDTVLHAFWTQSGSAADGYAIRFGMGVIRHSTASVLALSTWSAEDTFLGPVAPDESFYAAMQVRTWQGPTFGLGVTANFAGFSVPSDHPIEWSQVRVVGGPTLETDSVNCTITITGTVSSIGLGCAAPPDGVVGEEYRHTFPVSGGTPPYTFAIISGILPPGLTLDSLTGEVSGTPTLAGDFEFTIQVSDDFGSTVGTCDIVITVTDLPASGIGCGSPPGGEIGVSYSHTFPVSDIPSGATVVYSITGGALPPGLTLNTSTGQVTGTPTTEGHYGFTITATIT